MYKSLAAFIFLTLINLSAKATFLCAQATQGCAPKNEIERLQIFQCESSKTAHNCDDFYKKNLNVRPKDCNALVQCPSLVKVADYGASCVGGAIDSVVDSARGVAAFVLADTHMAPEMAEREEFFRNCTTAECKREMLGPYVGLFKKEEIEGHPNDKNVDPKDPANEVYLQGLSAKTLYRKLLPQLKEKFDNKTLNEPFIEPWSGKTVDLEKVKTLDEMIASLFEKAGVYNTDCYSPEVLAEMRCYALTILLDPFVMAKGIVAIRKAAGMTSKSLQDSVGQLIPNKEVKAADSLLEKSKIASVPLVDPKVVITKYPKVAEKIDGANLYLREKKFDEPFKDLRSVDWDAYAGDFISKKAREGLPEKLKEMDSEIKGSIHGVLNKMNDKEAFISYMEQLHADAIVDIEKKGISKELAGLQAGEVSENAVLRVLVRRAQERGQGRLSMIVNSKKGKTTTSRKPDDDNIAFREAIGQGSFFDKPFKGARHGMSSHLLQQDYVADVINTSTKGNPQKFWNYLGSNQGINFWVPLFDSAKSASFTSPEFTSRIVRKYLKFK